MATVRVGLTRVINLGDYETLKIDIAVEDSEIRKADGNVENASETFDRVFNFVERKLDEKVDIVEGK